jgi:anti-sigma factor RsiW
MTCRDVTELLIEYIAGELAAEQAEHVRQHLDDCPPCVHYVATYHLTIQLTRRLPAAEPPPALLDRLRAAAAEGHAG